MNNDEKIHSVAVDMLSDYLVKHKMRRTAERFAILESVLTLSHHFDIEELYHTMDEGGYHVSRTTIYSTMDILEKCGVVCRHDFGSSSALYERASSLGNSHHHLVCTRCGKIREVKDARINAAINSSRYSSFHPSAYSLTVYGLCSRCQRKSRRASKLSSQSELKSHT